MQRCTRMTGGDDTQNELYHHRKFMKLPSDSTGGTAKIQKGLSI